MSILVVLTIIMLAMAASYATLRSQNTMLSIAENGQSRSNARNTAQAAMSIALRRMHVASGSNAWAGADTSFSASFSDSDRYTIAYHTGITDVLGNPQLPDANDATATAEWPFCVTVVATGYGKSGQNGLNETSHRIRCVVRLSKPALPATPNNWSLVPNFNLIQWANSDVEMNLPARIDGWAYTQGGWNLAANYPVDHEVRPFAGRMDEVTLYNTALSQTQIQQIGYLVGNYDYGNYSGLPLLVRILYPYSLPNPIARWKLNEADSSTVAVDSAGSRDGTYHGAKPSAFSTPSPGNRGASFDGFNDFVDLGRFDITGNSLTILGWIRADNFNNNDTRIISKATSAASQDHWWALGTALSGGGIKLRFSLKAGGSTAELTASSGNLSANTWTFVAATYDGSEMRLYKDGMLVGNTAKSGAINGNSNASVYLGANPPGSARARYLRDLRAMELAGLGAVMPLHDNVYLPRGRTSAEMRSLLDEDLQTPTIDMTGANANSFVSHPSSISSYRLYPGGKSYSVASLGASLWNTTRQANVQTNPLGIFARAGSITLYDNVSVQGTMIVSGTGASGDIEISGKNNVLQPVLIPRLDGTGATFQLPIVIAQDDFKVLGSAGVAATGAIVTGDDFRADEGNDTVSFVVQGKVIAREFYVYRRWQWENKSGNWWRDRLADFLAQLSTPSASSYSPYFPQWLKNTQGLDPEPKIKIGPDPTNPTYHWHPFGIHPLFTYDSGTASGMNWDVISWEDGV